MNIKLLSRVIFVHDLLNLKDSIKGKNKHEISIFDVSSK